MVQTTMKKNERRLDPVVGDYVRQRVMEECGVGRGVAAEIARQAFMSQAHISNIVDGTRNVGEAFAKAMARRWRMTFAALRKSAYEFYSATGGTAPGALGGLSGAPVSRGEALPLASAAGGGLLRGPNLGAVPGALGPGEMGGAYGAGGPVMGGEPQNGTASAGRGGESHPNLAATIEWCRGIYPDSYLEEYSEHARWWSGDRPKQVWLADVQNRYNGWVQQQVKKPAPGASKATAERRGGSTSMKHATSEKGLRSGASKEGKAVAAAEPVTMRGRSATSEGGERKRRPTTASLARGAAEGRERAR